MKSFLSFALVFALALTQTSACASKEKRDVAKTIDASAPSSARYFASNEESWSARWRMIRDAKNTVDLTYFIIEDDIFGLSLLGLLHHKAKQGVKVRLMIDSRGTFELSRIGMGRDIIQEIMATGNAEVRIYNPAELQLGQALATLDYQKIIASNHDKITIADKSQALMGGRNISRDYMATLEDHDGAWFDGDVMIEGGAVADVQRAFDDEYNAEYTRKMYDEKLNLDSKASELTWLYRAMNTWMNLEKESEKEKAMSLEDKAIALEGKLILPLEKIPSDSVRDDIKDITKELVAYPGIRGLDKKVYEMSPAKVTIVDSTSTQTEGQGNQINEMLRTLTDGAQKELIFMTPYLVLTESAFALLKEAHDRGVKITIYTNSPISSDSLLTQAMFLRAWPLVLEAMPNLELYVFGRKRLVHAKVGAIDDRVAMVGSYNLDFLSAFINSEILAVLDCPQAAADVEKQIRDLVDLGEPDTYRYRLKRDENGKVLLDEDGKALIAFGPKDHVPANLMTEISRTALLLSGTPAILPAPKRAVGKLR